MEIFLKPFFAVPRTVLSHSSNLSWSFFNPAFLVIRKNGSQERPQYLKTIHWPTVGILVAVVELPWQLVSIGVALVPVSWIGEDQLLLPWVDYSTGTNELIGENLSAVISLDACRLMCYISCSCMGFKCCIRLGFIVVLCTPETVPACYGLLCVHWASCPAFLPCLYQSGDPVWCASLYKEACKYWRIIEASGRIDRRSSQATTASGLQCRGALGERVSTPTFSEVLELSATSVLYCKILWL